MFLLLLAHIRGEIPCFGNEFVEKTYSYVPDAAGKQVVENWLNLESDFISDEYLENLKKFSKGKPKSSVFPMENLNLKITEKVEYADSKLKQYLSQGFIQSKYVKIHVSNAVDMFKAFSTILFEDRSFMNYLLISCVKLQGLNGPTVFKDSTKPFNFTQEMIEILEPTLKPCFDVHKGALHKLKQNKSACKVLSSAYVSFMKKYKLAYEAILKKYRENLKSAKSTNEVAEWDDRFDYYREVLKLVHSVASILFNSLNCEYETIIVFYDLNNEFIHSKKSFFQFSWILKIFSFFSKNPFYGDKNFIRSEVDVGFLVSNILISMFNLIKSPYSTTA